MRFIEDGRAELQHIEERCDKLLGIRCEFTEFELAIFWTRRFVCWVIGK